MTAFTIKRDFAHKELGAIGAITLIADVASVKLNDKVLPEGAIEYLLTFALQTFQDAYAGAKTKEDATAAFDKKIKRVVEDKIGMREGGGINEEQRVGRIIVRELINAGKAKITKEAFKALSDDEKVKTLDNVLAKNLAKLSPKIANRINQMRREREERKAGIKEIELDI